MKKCPYCAEEIQDEAIKCRWCGEMLNGTKNQEPRTVSAGRQPLFGWLGVIALGVAFVTPKLVVSVPLLGAATAAIVALARKEKYVALPTLVLLGCLGLVSVLAVGEEAFKGPARPTLRDERPSGVGFVRILEAKSSPTRIKVDRSVNSATLTTFDPGEEIRADGMQGTWYRVVDGGWVHHSDVAFLRIE